MEERGSKRARIIHATPTAGITLQEVLDQLKNSLSKFASIAEAGDYLQEHLKVSEIGETLRHLKQHYRKLLSSIEVANYVYVLKANVDTWVKILPLEDSLSLALCSSSMFSSFAPAISAQFRFKERGSPFVYYSPKHMYNVRNLSIIPSHVQSLSLASDFDQKDLVISPSVTHLDVSHCYNINVLPNLSPNITSLRITSSLRVAQFPPNLSELDVSHSFLPNSPCLPQSLTSLRFKCVTVPDLSYLTNLKELIIIDSSATHTADTWSKLPPSLQMLEIERGNILSLDNLPSSLTSLDLHSAPFDNKPILMFGGIAPRSSDHLPATLNFINFGPFYNAPVNTLPQSLTHVFFGAHFNDFIDNLPRSVTHIVLGRDFDLPVKTFPPALTHLKFGMRFNRPVSMLPLSLQYLHFGPCFNQPFGNLPSLTHLDFDVGSPFWHFSTIPPSVSTFRFGIPLHSHSRSKYDTLFKLPNLFQFSFRFSKSQSTIHHVEMPKKIQSITYEIYNGDQETELSLKIDFAARLVSFYYSPAKQSTRRQEYYYSDDAGEEDEDAEDDEEDEEGEEDGEDEEDEED